jgi:serine/threonine-protein kinase RsbW
MTANEVDQLILGSQLADMERLPGWVEVLGERYGIGEQTKFAIHLCLEEAVSNVIRHGYSNSPGLEVMVNFSEPRKGYFVFAVEDNSPHFNPLEQEELPKIGPGEPERIGGQGIRLIKSFADSLEYEEVEGGNRLRMGFGDGGSSAKL